MKPWSFGRPKGPGYGISKDYYLTALIAQTFAPAIAQIANPKGERGGLEGFGAPLSAVGKDKTVLEQPMARGAYAFASKDRKTVLRALVMSREEAGFDPEPVAKSALASRLDADLIARIRSTWLIAQITFESHDPAVHPSLHFAHGVVARMAALTGGAVADPISERYFLPQDWPHPPISGGMVDVRDLVAVHFRGDHGFTLGMRKLGLPELEMYQAPDDRREQVERLMLGVCQGALAGARLEPLGDVGGVFELRQGGADLGMWEGIPVLELVPAKPSPIREALDRMRV